MGMTLPKRPPAAAVSSSSVVVLPKPMLQAKPVVMPSATPAPPAGVAGVLSRNRLRPSSAYTQAQQADNQKPPEPNFNLSSMLDGLI